MGWVERIAGLRDLPGDISALLIQQSQTVAFPEGTQVFAPGQPARNMLLLVSGVVRVQQSSDSGRDLFLYRVHAGESCVLTTACMLEGADYSAEAYAETDIEAIAIPRPVFDELVARSPAFRSFVFQGYARRIADLFGLIEAIVFHRVDVRLAACLLDKADRNRVRATHQSLAVELGSAREVISRLLSDFQRRGWVETGRGEITLLDPHGLKRLARSVT